MPTEEKLDTVPCTAKFISDLGITVLPVQNKRLPVFSCRIGGANDKFASAFAFDLHSSTRVSFASAGKADSPYFIYYFAGWYNELTIHSGSRHRLAFHFKTGIAGMSYYDQADADNVYYQEYNEQSGSYNSSQYYFNGLIASDNYFSFEPGLTGTFMLTRWADAGAAWNMRLLAGRNKDNPLWDDGFYSGLVFLRIKAGRHRS